ncbi:MAG: SufS family cysteine desulfurase [Thermoproteota archaeon]|nr:SufS family cysteine desulfurase [Candidatus Brockarchaeota archaeon]
MPFDPYVVREDFPIFKKIVNGRNLIYFDNAATTQKPRQVVEAIRDYYFNYNSNVLRSINTLSAQATDLYINSRRKIASFIGAREDEVVFTKNTTEGLNSLAEALPRLLGRKLTVVTSIMEHHSNLLPWRRMVSEKGGRLIVVGMDSDFTVNMDELERRLEEGCDVLTIVHVSNVLGTINPVKELCRLAHKHGSLFVIDAAQSIPHMPFNVKEVEPDFMVFSGHKMLGPTGIGVLYIRRSLIEKIEPWELGGGMVKTVTMESQTYEDIPFRFEAGTPNVEGVVGLAAAVDYLNNIGLKNIVEHEANLVKHLMEGLDESFIKVHGPDESSKHKGIVSFSVKDIHPHDVAQMLDADGIMVRSGALCAEPLVNALGVNAVIRVSFYLYNTVEEVDRFLDSMKKLRMLT